MNRFPRVSMLRSGYEPDAVDAFIRRIEASLGRGTMLGPPVTGDEIRAVRFRSKLGGYNETAVDYALDAFIIAVETRDEPVAATVDDQQPVHVGNWFETQAARVERAAFSLRRLGMGYAETEVDAFLDHVVATLRGTTTEPLTPADVRAVRFSTTMFKVGYAITDVDAFLTEVAEVLEHRPAHR